MDEKKLNEQEKETPVGEEPEKTAQPGDETAADTSNTAIFTAISIKLITAALSCKNVIAFCKSRSDFILSIITAVAISAVIYIRKNVKNEAVSLPLKK